MSEDRPVDAGAMTEAFVPIARPDVVQVEIDGEIVLYDDRDKVMHRLSPSAAQVWRCLDGSGSLAEIASDLAEVYQVDQGQVLVDVLATANQFGSAGLLVGAGDQRDEHDVDARERAEEPDGPFVFELATCMDGSFPLGEAGTLTVKMGPYLLGVRLSTPELVDMARDVFAPSLVEGVVAPPNVSVKQTEAGAGRPLLYCYRSGVLVTRARSPQRAIQAAASLLSTYVPPVEGGVRVAAMAAVRSGTLVLFSPESWWVAAHLVPRLRAAGWERLDALEVELDPQGRVVIAPLAVTLDTTALAALPAHRADRLPPASGRYPVAAWVAVPGDDPMPESMAGRVALVAAYVADLSTASAAAVVETTAAMLEGAAWVVSPSLDPNDLAATLARVV